MHLNMKFLFPPVLAFGFILFIAVPGLSQVQGSSTEMDGIYQLEKSVPKGTDTTSFATTGKAKRYYIIQLARFEKMYGIPDRFPKGTTLWFNPDIGVEAILISTRMYRSFESARTAAEEIKAEGVYPNAFARPHPFMVKYE